MTNNLERASRPPAPPSWSSIPNKFQLAIVCSVRIVDFFQQAALQAYMFYQLASFAPSASESEISFQVGVLQGVFTAAQIVTSILWGRVADNPSFGRKSVILISLVGQGISCAGVAFSGSFTAAVVWRLLGGAVNATVGGARTALSESTEKKYHSRTFLLLPLAWNIANIFGPLFGGMLSDPVRYHPSLFGKKSLFGGQNGVAWMKAYPYAPPNLFCALLLFMDAGLVVFGLRETLPACRFKRDRGIECSENIRYRLNKVIFRRFGYSRLDASDFASGEMLNDESGTDGTPMATLQQKESISTKPVASVSIYRAFTSNVFFVLSTVAILDFTLGGFTSLWTILLSTDRRSSSDPRPDLPFTFTGGLGFSPSIVGLSMSILGITGIICQLTLYPRVNARFGLLKCTTYSLFIFPITYALAPYLSLLSSVQTLLWTGIICVGILQISARSFAIPGVVLLTNNSTPHPELLGTIHGMGAATSSAFRTLGPIVASHWYSKGLERGRVGEAWWLLALSALIGCIPTFWVSDGVK